LNRNANFDQIYQSKQFLLCLTLLSLAIDFFKKLVKVEPTKRYTATEAV